jgi:positive regulator of sigma E activity
MKKSYLNRGIIFVLAGICFLLAAVFTESIFDGLLWGFAGGALGPGIGMIIQHIYWSAPKNQERYQEIQEQKDINLHDELNEKLRDKSGRIAYNIGLFIICISEIVFSILGKTGVITDYKIIVLYLFSLFIFQIVIGFVVYHQLRRKY